MVVNSNMRNVGRHVFYGGFPSHLQKGFLAGGIVLQNGRTILEPLSPFSPPPGRVAPSHRKDGRTSRRLPSAVQVVDLSGRKIPHSFQSR